jgi:RNA polymerase sigma factor (sigma-70 family)
VPRPQERDLAGGRGRQALGNNRGGSCVSTTMGHVTTPADSPPTPWDPGLLDVYRSGYVDLVRLAVLVGADRSVAEELVQDAFVAVHRTWDRVRDPVPYLRRTVVNRCRSWGRRQTLERDRRPRPADPALLVADELWDALARLPERQREAIVCRFYLDLPDAEIAAILDCRPATVRTAIHRGLAKLREEVPR